jgi:hypothetical protein
MDARTQTTLRTRLAARFAVAVLLAGVAAFAHHL